MRCGAARCAFARHHQYVHNHGRPMEYHDRVYPLLDVDRRHTFRSFEACSLAASFSSAAANDEVSRSGQLACDLPSPDEIGQVDA